MYFPVYDYYHKGLRVFFLHSELATEMKVLIRLDLKQVKS